MSFPAVETRGLTKYFKDLPAVRNLNLTIPPGEMFGLVGPDGAGKTTTIRMLCGVIRPTSGAARILGFDLNTQSEQVKQNIGYLSQKFSLYGDLTVDENIEFFAEVHSVKDFRKRREELLEFTRLAPFRRRLADRLSGGMRQKLALACTLVHTPRVIFLDEPTTGVDPVSRRDFWKILSHLLKEGITIFMTTPYMDEAERCARVGLMDRGVLLVMDTPSHIKSLMKGTIIEIVCEKTRLAFHVLKKTAAALEVQIFGDRLNVIVEDRERDLPLIQAGLRKEKIEVVHARVIPPSLETVFISLTKSPDREERPAPPEILSRNAPK
ncbi:MAG: ABC transporter ATP-binding protein [Candidatus Aminicenantales bacterium]